MEYSKMIELLEKLGFEYNPHYEGDIIVYESSTHIIYVNENDCNDYRIKVK